MHIDNDGCLAAFLALLGVILLIAASMGVVILFTWFICWCFNIPFNVWYGVGAWFILALLRVFLD